jgi:hypothetical protein
MFRIRVWAASWLPLFDVLIPFVRFWKSQYDPRTTMAAKVTAYFFVVGTKDLFDFSKHKDRSSF